MGNEVKNKRQRERRLKTNNADTKKYERTKNGKLMRTYRNMESRVMGIQKKKAHLYGGKDIIDRESFYHWSLANNDFNILYDNWVESDYSRKLSPSIDRIDTLKGYTIDNIRWLTHSENSRNGAINKHTKINASAMKKPKL